MTDIDHASDCAVHNAPAYEPGPCDCGAEINTLIRDLEAVPEGNFSLWLRAVRLAYDQGWHDNERRELNEYLIGRAFDLNEENILLAVAVSLVPEGLFWNVDSSGSAFLSTLGTVHQDVTTADGETPALALTIAALKARSAS
jgi:hypothetical protein